MSALSTELSERHEVEAEAMSPEQLQSLLTFMVVLTTVSFLLVFVMVAALVVFMCFTRPNRRGCQCSAHGKMEAGDLRNLQTRQTNNNTVLIRGNTVPGQFLGQIMTSGPPVVVAGPKLAPVNPAKMKHGLVTTQTGQLVTAEVPELRQGAAGSIGRVQGAVSVNRVQGTAVCSLPSVAQGAGDGSNAPRRVQGAAECSTLPSRVQVNPGYCPSPEPSEQMEGTDMASEPIYEEIGAVVTCPESSSKVLDHQKVVAASANNNNNNNGTDKSGSSVEYWHITAKEIVKFRPCTETFIERP